MIVCKVCGNQNEVGAQFCGSCGSFLEWTGESTEDTTVVQPPRPIPTIDPGPPQPQPQPQPEPIPAGAVICRNCGTANEPSRVYCRSCATELAAAMPPDGQGTLPPLAPNQSGGGSRLPPVAYLGLAVVGILVVGALGIFVFGGGPGATTPPSSLGPTTAASPTATPSTSPSAGSPSPSVSPSISASPEPVADQRILLMIDAGDSPDGIGIMNPDGRGLKRIVSGQVHSPAWRPDHQRIVFVKENGLATANPDGSDEEELTPPGSRDSQPEWSPDGEWILFDRGRDGSKDVFIIRPDGSDLRNVTKRDGEDRTATWSPDGTKIAWTLTSPNGNREIYVMDVAGGERQNLTKSPARDIDPVWSPDGSTILFASDRGADVTHLFFLDVATQDVRVAVPGGDEPDHDPAWSPDGTKFVFHRGENNGLYVIIADLEGNELVTVRRESPLRLPAWK